MVSISLGPIALPMGPVMLLLCVWFASWIATRLCAWQADGAHRREGADAAGHGIWVAAGIGLLVARLAHLALNAGPYTESPASMLDVRDGGWHIIAGLFAGVAWLVRTGWTSPGCRRSLALGASTGLLLWTAGTMATGTHGTPMPNTPLAALTDGQTRTLGAAASGRPVVVNLWASWCGPCRQEMPTLAVAQQRDTGVGVLFVNQGESEATIRSYLSSARLSLNDVWLDRGSLLGKAVGSRGLPTTLFYDGQGKLVDAHFGVLNAAALEARIDALRASR